MNGGPLLLLVDDDGDDVAIALRALRRSELSVEVRTARMVSRPPPCSTSMAAGARASRCSRVIFLDLKMPLLDDFRCLARAAPRAAHSRGAGRHAVHVGPTGDIRRA
jgi:CheY-like chemotaxis protein